MNSKSRVNRFAASFCSVAVEIPAGTLYRSPRPISLSEALGRAVARRLVRDSVQPLIEFGQDPDGNRTVELGVLSFGLSYGFMCLRQGRDDPGCAVAAAVCRSPGPLLSTWLITLLAHNGAGYGVDVLRRLPPWIRCSRPDLLRRDLVQRAMWRWLEWANRAGACPWSELRRHVVDRVGRDEWSPSLSHEDCRSLLRRYFAVSYVEDTSEIVPDRVRTGV
jgi:hypothetical protein